MGNRGEVVGILPDQVPSEAGTGVFAPHDLTIAATALNQGIMQCVTAQLAQYQWSYKRFKTVSPGMASIYESGVSN